MLDYKNVYRDIAPKADIISGALAYGRGRLGAQSAMTLDVLKEGALAVIKGLAVEKLRPQLDTVLEDATIMFQIENGDRPAALAADNEPNWRDAFDAHLLEALGTDLQRAIGPSAIGEHFTDADVDDDDVRRKVAIECAERLAESAMPMDTSDPNNVKPSVNKTLSAAGVVDGDFAPYVSGASVSTPATTPMSFMDEPQARARVEQIVGAYALAAGAERFDPLVLDELLDSAFDDDFFIAVGAIERLGGTTADQPAFLSYMRAAPLEAKGNTLSAALAALASGTLVETPKATGKKIKTTAKAGAALPKPATSQGAPPSPAAPPPLAPPAPPGLTTQPATGGASTLNGDYASVINLWRDNAKDTDQTIATAIGVSRPQVSNIANGKAKCPLDATQRAKLRALLSAKATALYEAADLLG